MALPAEIISLAAQVVDDLRARGETISTAESLTAGAVSSVIVTIAGASDVFVGGTTAYRDEIKKIPRQKCGCWNHSRFICVADRVNIMDFYSSAITAS